MRCPVQRDVDHQILVESQLLVRLPVAADLQDLVSALQSGDPGRIAGALPPNRHGM